MSIKLLSFFRIHARVISKLNIVFVLGLLMLSQTQAQFQNQEKLLQQIPYKDVLALPVEEPNQYIKYGDSEFQFVEGWVHDNTMQTTTTSIIFIHGGCWLNAFSLEHARALMTFLFNQGFNVWSIEYRRTGDPGGGWPGTYNDILLALDTLSASNKLSLNTSILAGHSAGGHLALLAGTQFEALKAVVALAPIYDVVAYAKGSNSCQQATEPFMGGKSSVLVKEYEKANPASQKLNEKSVIFYGLADQIIPTTQFESVDVAELIPIPEAGHFDFIHPQSAAWQQIIKVLKE